MSKLNAGMAFIFMCACSSALSQPLTQPVPAAPPAQSAGAGQPGAPESQYVGEMYKIGLGWHPAALQNVPKDKYGLADWVQMLNKGLIRPRSYLDPSKPEDPPLDLEIVMPSNTNLLAGAHFPHSVHTAWLNCETCHVKIFIPQVGANKLTMSRIVRGEACGVCHGKVAFPLNHCERCHVPASAGGNRTAAPR